MTTYYGLYGQKVQYLASDPTDLQIGQVWYNSTSATLKVRSFNAAAWSSGGNLSEGRDNAGAGSNNGTQTAYLISGGSPGAAPPSPVHAPITTAAEKYNGTTWTSAGNMSVQRRSNSGAGTQTASLSIGGADTTNSASTDNQLYNGSSWTTGTGIPANRREGGACGTQTATLYIGGFFAPPSVGPPYDNNNNTFIYNGSTWTTGNTYPTDIYNSGASGTSASAISSGGTANPFPGGLSPTSAVNSWNGTTWTGLTSMPAAQPRVLGAGTQSTQFAFGSGFAYDWNGASWTIGTQSSTARTAAGGGTSSTATLLAGGPSGSAATEEYNGAAVATKTVTVS